MRGRNPFDGKPKLTLRDVAEAAKVSEMTVSRVLRGRGDVSEKTKKTVHEAARALGYVPNKIAGALASSRVNLVGVVIPSLANQVFPDVLHGIGNVLDATPLQPVIGATQYDPETEERVIYEMLSWRPSGLIVAGLEHTEAARAMMAAAAVPIVEVMDTDGEQVLAKVGISHLDAGLQMAREIIRRGYSKIAYLGTNSPGDHRARKRLEGLRQGLGEAGLSLADECLYDGTSGFGTGRSMTRDVLKRTPDLDFLYYSTDLNAAGGLLYCLEMGLDVPGRIGLAGFNNFSMLDGLPLKVATMDSRRTEIGSEAARIIADGQISRAEVVLTPDLVPGDTMRPA